MLQFWCGLTYLMVGPSGWKLKSTIMSEVEIVYVLHDCICVTERSVPVALRDVLSITCKKGVCSGWFSMYCININIPAADTVFLISLTSIQCLITILSLLRSRKSATLILYLGGNRLTHVPSELGQLSSLSTLILCGNQLRFLPKELTKLSNLQSLRLHDNQLQTLPQGLMKLTNLRELSLQNKPLVLRFVKEWPNTVPTLLELSGRCVTKNSIPYTREFIPGVLVEYLNRVVISHDAMGSTSPPRSKFVAFCGKY